MSTTTTTPGFVCAAGKELNAKHQRSARRVRRERSGRGRRRKRSGSPRCKTRVRVFRAVEPTTDEQAAAGDTLFAPAEAQAIAELEAMAIEVEVEDRVYQVNVRARVSEGDAGTVLFLHGFGSNCQWMTWAKLAVWARGLGRSAVFVDLPGFGRSSGRDVQTGVWRRDGPEIVVGLLRGLGIRDSVATVGYCGGAATAYRAMVKYPRVFAGQGHVAHNSVIAAVPKELEAVLEASGSRLTVTWAEDEDHSRLCVAYKTLAKLRARGSRAVSLVDIEQAELPAYGPTAGASLTRRGGTPFVFCPSATWIDRWVDTLAQA